MKRLIAMMLCVCMMLGLVGCGGGDTADNKVVIYSSAEEFRNEYFLSRLNEQFPQYDITIQYIATGNNASKLKSEGTDTEADIVLGLETGYLISLKDMMEDLSGYDTSQYLPEMVDPNHIYMTMDRESNAIIINPQILQEKGLEAPKSYEDLLDPKYKGLISMPNPKSSSTGYAFLLSLCNAMGQDQALAYFEKLSGNVLQFTSSGSGPVNALVQGEAAIGLGMTFQAVQEINKGANLEILYFDEGAPYSTYGISVVKGRMEDPAVKEVFDFICNTLVMEDKQKFVPEQIFKDQNTVIDNYPTEIPYADMTGMDDLEKKEELLALWQY